MAIILFPQKQKPNNTRFNLGFQKEPNGSCWIALTDVPLIMKAHRWPPEFSLSLSADELQQQRSWLIQLFQYGAGGFAHCEQRAKTHVEQQPDVLIELSQTWACWHPVFMQILCWLRGGGRGGRGKEIALKLTNPSDLQMPMMWR